MSAVAPTGFLPLYRQHLATLEAGYARLLAQAGLDAVVIHSGAPHKRTRFDDQYWPLRPTPHFQHWLPLAEPGCALVIAPGKRPRLVWPRPKDFWEDPAPADTRLWQDSFEVIEVQRPEDVAAHLPGGRVAFVGEDAAQAAAFGLADRLASDETMRALDRLRVTKTDHERTCIAEANRVAAAGHRAVSAAFFAGDASELELHLAFLAATGQDDPETPYKNIVALGAHAATLHHVSYGRRKSGASSLLLDAGATCLGYTSDVTRTFVKGDGAAAGTFAALVEKTEAMQQRLCAGAVPGLKYEALHDRAHEELGVILTELGVVKTSPAEAVAGGLTRAFFPHGLGHSLGLQCHDVGCAEVKPRPDNPFLRNTSVIAPGQVFTIEPGVYFIDLLLAPLREGPGAARVDWALVDALRPFGGVRIEDDVAVRADGPVENLTRAHLPT
jgi:Xaa-Pro dipeptidase